MEIDCPFDKLLPITEATVWSWFDAMHAEGLAVRAVAMPKWAYPKVMKLVSGLVIVDGFDRWLYGAKLVQDKKLKDSVVLLAW